MSSNKCKCLAPSLVMASCSRSKTSSRSVVKFFNSIPDYDELTHLSENEFYSRLGTLRETYSKIKYGSDSTLSTDTSKSSDESIETVKEMKIKSKRSSLISKDLNKENRQPNSILQTASKALSSIAHKSIGKLSRRTKSASPVRRHLSRDGGKFYADFKLNCNDNSESPVCEVTSKAKTKNRKAGFIPLTSRVPIYDQIMEDQKQRSEIRKLESAIELQSKIKPFHFSTRSRSRCSNASAVSGNEHIKKEKYTKSAPSKKTNSSYFNGKKWEEDYFRRISRIIRAEELLKLSTPSPVDKKDLARPKSNGSCKHCTRKKNRKKKNKVKLDTNDEKLDTTDTKTTTPENDDNDTHPAALPIYPVARPNLAAKLRAEVARKRTQKLSERSQPKTLHNSNWGVKKNPAWKSLALSETNDEDISYRIATRRAELNLRQREHALNMELMKERVRAAPLLLEGTTYWSHRVGKASHQCGRESMNSFDKLDKKRVKSASSCPFETKFVKKISGSANYLAAQKNNDSDDLASEDRAYL